MDINDSRILARRKFESEELAIILDLLIIYNPRICEILNLRKSGVIPGRFVILSGAKGSADIIVRDRELISRITKLSEKRSDHLFVSVTYGFLYRYIREHFGALISRIQTKKNKKITHAFRYLNVRQIETESHIKTILHHNSKASNKYYINKT